MSRRKTSFTLSVSGAFGIHWLFASADALAAEPIEEVTVRASDVGQVVARARVADSVRDTSTVVDLVENLPGVHVRRFGTSDSFGTISIRGTSSTQSLIFLGGVPLSGGADPTVDLASIPLFSGTEVRAYRSFAPLELGPVGLGGALRIDPHVAGPARTEVSASVGSFGAARIRASQTAPAGEGHVGAGVSLSRSDDDFFYERFGAPGNPVRRNNAGHAAASAFAEYRAPVENAWLGRPTLKAFALLSGRDQETPGPAVAPTPDARLGTVRALTAVTLEREAGRRGGYAVRTFARVESRSLRDRPNARPFDPSRADSATLALGQLVSGTFVAGSRVRATFLAEGRGEMFRPGRYEGPNPQTDASRLQVGAGASVEARITPSLTAFAQARLDGFAEQSQAVSPSGALAAPLPTAHAGVEWRVRRAHAMIRGGRSARPPSFVERFGNLGAFLPSPNLRSEDAVTLDALLEGRHREGKLTLDAHGAAFASFASDLIAFVPIGAAGLPKATNLERARVIGLELQASGRYAWFELRGTYNLLDTRQTSRCIPAGCPTLPGRPAHDLSLDALAHAGSWVLRTGFDVVSGMRFDESGQIAIPGRALVSAGVRWLAIPRIGLRAGFDVRNLLDARTGTYAGFLGPIEAPLGDLYYYPLPGRSFLATIEVKSLVPSR